MVDHHLKFDIHISLAVRKAMLRSRLILKCFSSRIKHLLLKAYITYVRPILEYRSPVSGVGRILVWGRIEAPSGRGAEGAEGVGLGCAPSPENF